MILEISIIPHCIDSGSVTQHLWGAFFAPIFTGKRKRKIMKTVKGSKRQTIRHRI